MQNFGSNNLIRGGLNHTAAVSKISCPVIDMTEKSFEYQLDGKRRKIKYMGIRLGGPELTLATCGLEELFFQLCCRVSFWFWREIGFGLHTYKLRVPYSCGVVSVFLLLAGNSFWYVCTYHTVVVLC